ncbi:LuxR family transcriptional regulator [Roseibium aquae]|uniref:LuxR family transcriptional regulator n=1 Tax=Roseibium aquae TaxID=1323746 RepID=A0A916T885_9HYPH|nr:DoxX family protein [Roseibium aquae]GGB35572.1 LuxR family transcriptional regulator [Roseibium aquae]
MDLRQFQPLCVSLLRIVAGGMTFLHGSTKLLDWPYAAAPRIDLASAAGAIAVLELVCGALLVAGFLTRPAAFVAAILMAVVYALLHASGSVYPLLNGGEKTLLYGFVFLALAAVGGGAVSVDRLIGRR